ncbi:hypothetical protein NEMIN01_1174 [Nematocida minor]|uniref:uncharacterized protein n=1 Tax=Nematocida minor TaxID=1912983 RepID=UPI002220636E|nr:uncharacterized protein NEMIN01_1174 [Nematocida minor]KAI5190709.1 hypothetical protein NEMIN01_1174 [Nematocida minor]
MNNDEIYEIDDTRSNAGTSSEEAGSNEGAENGYVENGEYYYIIPLNTQDDTNKDAENNTEDIDGNIKDIGANVEDISNNRDCYFIGIKSRVWTARGLLTYIYILLKPQYQSRFANLLVAFVKLLLIGIATYFLFPYRFFIFLILLFSKDVRVGLDKIYTSPLKHSLIIKIGLALLILPFKWPTLLVAAIATCSFVAVRWIRKCLTSHKYWDALGITTGLASIYALSLSSYWIENIHNGLQWTILLQLTIFAALTFGLGVTTSFFIFSENTIKAIQLYAEFLSYTLPEIEERKQKLSALDKEIAELKLEEERIEEERTRRLAKRLTIGILGELKEENTRIKEMENEKEKEKKVIELSITNLKENNDIRSYNSSGYIEKNLDQLLSFSNTRNIIVELFRSLKYSLIAVSVIAGFSVLFISCYSRSELPLAEYILSIFPPQVTEKLSNILM